MKFATAAVHSGQQPDPATGATIPPIHVTSTYTQASPGVNQGYEYSRTDNPTRHNLEQCLAALEGGKAAAAFGSGLAATTAVVHALLRPGDSLLACGDLYGGTYRLFERVFRPWGLDARYADSTDAGAFARLLDSSTRLIWIETPTNPMLRLLDIAAIAQVAREANARRAADRRILLVVDNTFATPALQRPIELGADLVVHSTTKYLGGHSDVIGGAVISVDAARLEPIRFYQNAAGGVPGAFDCYLTQRGIKTLHLRMARHCENALQIARWAAGRREFERVIHPGLESHPDHALARRQMAGSGGIVTCVLAGGLDAAKRFLERTRLFACAESLGGVESLISHPATMTHASVPRERRARLGVVDGLVRLSVGIEDPADLIADLEAAFGPV